MTDYQKQLLFDMMDDINLFRESAKQCSDLDLVVKYTGDAIILMRVFRILNIHDEYKERKETE